MPGRIIPLVTHEVYHVFNRGIASQPTFLDKKDYQRALHSLFYYQNVAPPVKYSRFLLLSVSERVSLLEILKAQGNFHAEIIAYCLMPNHFHLLLRQVADEGISRFVGNFTNSYTRFFNTKRERSGPLFSGKFHAVRIETEEQLLHVSRYIHLNPYTAFIVKNEADLTTYPYSSFGEYMQNNESGFCTKSFVLDAFETIESYKQFVFDQADYQRTLDRIKHLVLE